MQAKVLGAKMRMIPYANVESRVWEMLFQLPGIDPMPDFGSAEARKYILGFLVLSQKLFPRVKCGCHDLHICVVGNPEKAPDSIISWQSQAKLQRQRKAQVSISQQENPGPLLCFI